MTIMFAEVSWGEVFFCSRGAILKHEDKTYICKFSKDITTEDVNNQTVATRQCKDKFIGFIKEKKCKNYPALEPHLQHYLGSSAPKLLQHLKKQNEAMIMSMAMVLPAT